MGVKTCPDAAQAIIKRILYNVDVEAYIDDCGIWTNGSFEDHLKLVDTVLQRLAENGMKCNPLKCDWAVQETDFLGFWMTPTSVKPMRNKIEAVLQMGRPQNQTQVRSFLGAVNFYKSLWPRRAHVLAPLNELTGTGIFKWTDRHERAFKEMKAVLATDCINAYPDYNLPFIIFSDASDYQIGACIMQEGRPIAYYSKSLDKAQQNYTTTEKELLEIVMCLKEYRKILYGGRITVYTDHKILTFRTLSVQRVLRWRTLKNVLADCFSRLPRMEKQVSMEDELVDKN